MRSTALSEVPGWYIEFQAAVLRQLPRPGQIDKSIAEGWTDNQKSLKKNLSECLVPPKWREEDGVIYCRVVSDGATGPQLLERLSGKGFHVRNNVRHLLLSSGNKPTKGSVTHIAILRGTSIARSNRTLRDICHNGIKSGFTMPHIEVMCLMREMFSDNDFATMGLRHIITMHEPILGSDGSFELLGVARAGNSYSQFQEYNFRGSHLVTDEWGFAFAVSQKSKITSEL